MPTSSRARTRDPSRRRRSMLEVRFPSDQRYLHMVRELARRLAESTGFEPSEAESIAMAVDEAVTNVIEHAYGGATDREIEIHFDPEGESLDIQILHDGELPQPLSLPEFDLKDLVAKRRKGGLGVHIMRKMMDKVDYGKAGSGKNMTVMVRYKRRKTSSK